MPPALPDDADDAWELLETDSWTLARTPTARITAETAVYEDGPLRRAVRDATGVDEPWRFVFGTDVSFSPPLPPGAGTFVAPTVASEARREFADDLRERGLSSVSRGETRRVRGDRGRARLTEYRAVREVDRHDVAVRCRGVLGVAAADGSRIAGGVWPDQSLPELFGTSMDVETDPNALGDEVRRLVRRLL